MAGNVWRPENASRNLASTNRRSYPDSRTPEELRRSFLRQCETCDESNSQDGANAQGDTNPLPLALDNNPEVKREESEEEGGFGKAGCEEECEKSRQECKACKYKQGCEEGFAKDSGQESKKKTEQNTGEYAQGFEEDCEEASEQVAGEYAQGYGEGYEEDYEEGYGEDYEEGYEEEYEEEYEEDYEEDYEADYEEASEEESGEDAQGSEEESGEYAQSYEEYYEEASEEDGEAANFTSSHKQLKHKAPSGRGKMGNSVDMENQKHTTLRCSHCQGPHRKLNCPELPCSHCKVQGHVSLLCAERLAKIRKNKNTEMRNRRKREAKGPPAPVASGDTSQQSEKTNAENPRKRKSRRPPSTPTGSDHESASNDNGDPSSPEANQDSNDDDGPQDSSASAKKTQEQEKTARPMRCDNCKGPHRKRVCPHLPCAYCKEEGHTSGACPERLLKQQKTRTANMRMWRKSEASEKGKTGGGDDSKGVGDGSSDHDKPNRPRLRCSVCRGPHRKPACPELPCAYCGQRGHVRHDCPKRLADREELVASRKRQKKSKQD